MPKLAKNHPALLLTLTRPLAPHLFSLTRNATSKPRLFTIYDLRNYPQQPQQRVPNIASSFPCTKWIFSYLGKLHVFLLSFPSFLFAFAKTACLFPPLSLKHAKLGFGPTSLPAQIALVGRAPYPDAGTPLDRYREKGGAGRNMFVLMFVAPATGSRADSVRNYQCGDARRLKSFSVISTIDTMDCIGLVCGVRDGCRTA